MSGADTKQSTSLVSGDNFVCVCVCVCVCVISVKRLMTVNSLMKQFVGHSRFLIEN